MTIPEAWAGVHQHSPTAAFCFSYGIWKALHSGGVALACNPTAGQLPGSYHGDRGGEI